MPTVLESITTSRSLDRAVYVPTGVGYCGRPIDAGNTPGFPQLGRWCGEGSSDGGAPSMVTGKVWSEILATAVTGGPVWKFVMARLPTDSVTALCAGQNRLESIARHRL